MELEPLQKPHPPIWYGVHAPDSAARAARKGLQVVSLDPPGETCIAFDSFRAAWREARGAAPLPLMGLGRFIVVAPTDAEALAVARRAYPRWHASFTHLRRKHNRINAHPRPPSFDELAAVGQGVAGTPDTVTAALARQIEATGSNYLVGQFVFGDLSLAEATRSIELFALGVMPRLAARRRRGGAPTSGVDRSGRRLVAARGPRKPFGFPPVGVAFAAPSPHIGDMVEGAIPDMRRRGGGGSDDA